jgi:hypothetical protein
MSRPSARLGLVLVALALAACTSATAPSSQAETRAQRATAGNPTVHPMCDGGVVTGTGQC